MALSHLSMLIHELFNKDKDTVPEGPPLTILDIKSSVFMDENFNNTNTTRHITIRV